MRKVQKYPSGSNVCYHIRCPLIGGSRGGRGSDHHPPPLKNHKNIGFLCNTGPDPLKNHKSTKPAFNVGPSSVRPGNAISMAFCWRADDGPFKAVFGSSIPPSTKKLSIINISYYVSHEKHKRLLVFYILILKKSAVFPMC